MNKDNLLKNDGHLTDDAVYLFIDALKLDITDRLPAEILDHVQECQQCKKMIWEIYDLVRGQDYESLRPHPYLDQKKITTKFTYSTITRIAAAVVIGLGLAYLAYIFIPEIEQPVAVDTPIEEPAEITPEDFVTVPPDITKPEQEITIPQEDPKPADLFAANFEPSPFYENLAGQAFRSHVLRVQSPELGEEITDDIVFSWISRTPITVNLQLLDNTEKIIWDTTTDEQSVTFTSPLDPGVYYWRLETEEELLYVGKFIVPLP